MGCGSFKKNKRGEGIKHLSSLFDKYKNTLQAPQGTVQQAFVDSVQEVLEIDIPKKSCVYTVSSKTLCVQLPGPIKNEILLSKTKILEIMEQKLGQKNTPKKIL